MKRAKKTLYRGKNKKTEDILLEPKKDRRLLENVPDIKGIRSNIDRRGAYNLDTNKEDIDIEKAFRLKKPGGDIESTMMLRLYVILIMVKRKHSIVEV